MLTSCTTSSTAAGLSFNPSNGVPGELELPDGTIVRYMAYEGLCYVANVEDMTYQTMNLYFPEGADSRSPIFLRTYIGGYMAAKAARPQAGDATGRALREGFVVAIPGSRGRNSVQGDRYTGRAPNGLLDLKAAVRYLRAFSQQMPGGNTERIVIDGTSAGGAMSALVGATGNAPEYAPLLKAMGAADERDDVFASICFCPITDLAHADMAYEWLYNGTETRQKGNAAIMAISNELKNAYPAYLASLGLQLPDGTPLTADNCLDVIRREIIRAAQTAKDAGADIPGDIGFTFSEEAGFGAPPVNGGVGQSPRREKRPGEYITGLDMLTYLNFVASNQPLKTAPAFDTMGVEGQPPSGENDEFGDTAGSKVSFTPYGASKNGTSLSAAVAVNVYLMNPMDFIGSKSCSVAPHWYIRHGARDRDTAFTVPLCLAVKLYNEGKDVNFLLAWNRPHSGDYSLDELFAWLNGIIKP